MRTQYEMLYALPQGIFCINQEYEVLFWNKLMEFWTGISNSEVENKDVKELFPDLNRKFYKLMIHQLFESGSTAVFSYQLHKNLYKFQEKSNHNLCIQSQVVRSHSPENPNELIAVFSLQDISGLISQIQQYKKVKDQVLELLEKMKITQEELRISNDGLKKAASTDPLTGLNNRRSMLQFLDTEEKRHSRYGTAFSVILSDIDGFKKFNDTYGHACGDFILKHLGEIFHRTIRPTDSVCRWGGEEFLFLLPETNAEEAGQMAERLRNAILSNSFNFEDQKHKVSMTFGVSCIEHETGVTRIIGNADEALYYGKNNGKNRVVLYSELVDKT
jgi:diguanylate cyclase (GGDEF)-like protein/PAS domain S-box-containing protein